MRGLLFGVVVHSTAVHGSQRQVLVAGSGVVRRQQLDAQLGDGCPCEGFDAKVEFAGTGGNMYVLRFTEQCGAYPAGAIAKAWPGERQADGRDVVLQKMLMLPRDKELAGLSHGAQSAFTCTCAKVDEFANAWTSNGEAYTPESECAFLVLDNGGARTVESCLADPQTPPKALKYLALGILPLLEKMHGHGFTHFDLQPKNVMVDEKCSSNSLKVIDLDDMKPAAEGIRDYCQFFDDGMGAQKYHKHREDRTESECAAAIHAAFKAAFVCDFSVITEAPGALKKRAEAFRKGVLKAPQCK